jgi:hypothetical protein
MDCRLASKHFAEAFLHGWCFGILETKRLCLVEVRDWVGV